MDKETWFFVKVGIGALVSIPFILVFLIWLTSALLEFAGIDINVDQCVMY